MKRKTKGITEEAIKSYQNRNRLLRELGFESYSKYLDSGLWRGIRGRVLSASRFCRCGGVASQVHHERYTRSNLSGRTIEFLVAVCRDCHRKCEHRHGEKLAPFQATKRLSKIARGKRKRARQRERRRSRDARFHPNPYVESHLHALRMQNLGITP